MENQEDLPPKEEQQKQEEEEKEPTTETTTTELAEGDDAKGTDEVIGSAALRPVFLGNLVTDFSPDQCKELFQRPILPPDCPDAADFHSIAVDRVDVKRGYCFVFLKDAPSQQDKDMIEKFVTLINGMELDSVSTKLRAEFARGDGRVKRKEDDRRRNIQPSETLFVVNFPEESTKQEDLRMLFEPFGELLRIDMKRNYAFVQFRTIEQATKAKDATNGGKLDDSVLTVEYVARQRDGGDRRPRRDDYRGGGDRRGGGGGNYRRGGGDRMRGPPPDRYGRGGGGPPPDRYDNGPRGGGGRDDFRRRDRSPGYRGGGPSPEGGAYRRDGGGDPYRGDKDRGASPGGYGRARSRSRSRSPPRGYRSRSPPRRYDDRDGGAGGGGGGRRYDDYNDRGARYDDYNDRDGRGGSAGSGGAGGGGRYNDRGSDRANERGGRGYY
eukprot:Nitzschia sp. Nitz4//scaffold250_size28497//8023//9538//NITZ4_008124-RA/size28497-augustus-gene-0.0-mRNA-1//1//CDS//3329544213//2762//frame0